MATQTKSPSDQKAGQTIKDAASLVFLDSAQQLADFILRRYEVRMPVQIHPDRSFTNGLVIYVDNRLGKFKNASLNELMKAKLIHEVSHVIYSSFDSAGDDMLAVKLKKNVHVLTPYYSDKLKQLKIVSKMHQITEDWLVTRAMAESHFGAGDMLNFTYLNSIGTDIRSEKKVFEKMSWAGRLGWALFFRLMADTFVAQREYYMARLAELLEMFADAKFFYGHFTRKFYVPLQSVKTTEQKLDVLFAFADYIEKLKEQMKDEAQADSGDEGEDSTDSEQDKKIGKRNQQPVPNEKSKKALGDNDPENANYEEEQEAGDSDEQGTEEGTAQPTGKKPAKGKGKLNEAQEGERGEHDADEENDESEEGQFSEDINEEGGSHEDPFDMPDKESTESEIQQQESAHDVNSTVPVNLKDTINKMLESSNEPATEKDLADLLQNMIDGEAKDGLIIPPQWQRDRQQIDFSASKKISDGDRIITLERNANYANKFADPQMYKRIVQENRGTISTIINAVYDRLYSLSETRRLASKEGRRFRTREILKMANLDGYNSELPKYDNYQEENRSIACTLLVDNSGSMGGDKIKKARAVAVILSEVFTNANIPFEVQCFSTKEEYYGSGAVGRFVSVVNYVVKPFDSDNLSYLPAIGALSMEGNADGANIEYAGAVLLQRPEDRRIFFLISDGQPVGYATTESGVQHVKHARLILEENNCEFYTVGIYNPMFERFPTESDDIYGKNQWINIKEDRDSRNNVNLLPELFTKITDKVLGNI